MLRSQASSRVVAIISPRQSLLPFLYQTRTILSSTHPNRAQPKSTGSTRHQYSTKVAEKDDRDLKHHENIPRLDRLEREITNEIPPKPLEVRRFWSLSRGDQDLISPTAPEGGPRIRLHAAKRRHSYEVNGRREFAAFNLSDESRRAHRTKTQLKGRFWKQLRKGQIEYPFTEHENEVDDLDRVRQTFVVPQTQAGIQDSRVGDAFDDIDDSAELDKDLASEDSTRESTITTTEKRAFQQIFSDILARSKSSGERGLSINLPGDQETQLRPSKTKRKGLSLVADSREKGDALRAAVENYPAPLRAAAARALGIASDNVTMKAFENKAATQETQELVDELEYLRQPERERVESLMRAAKTDFELWKVMEKEVFSIVGKLGIDNSTEVEPLPRSKRRGRPRKNEVPKHVEKTPIPADSPKDVPPLALLGPLYPSHLLLGLRLLDRSFDKPSPLTLNVLPRIKALGLISHVLGASLALYNELLRIHWTQYDDFPGVLKLLEEMEAAGLDLNGDTLDVITDIRAMQRRVKLGEKGIALQALWALPEYAPQKFADWQAKIQSAMEQRGRELAQQSRIEAELRD